MLVDVGKFCPGVHMHYPHALPANLRTRSAPPNKPLSVVPSARQSLRGTFYYKQDGPPNRERLAARVSLRPKNYAAFGRTTLSIT